jgi:hypothetical protein
MTPEEKLDLEQLSLLIAVQKAHTLRTIRALLYSAVNQVRSYGKCQNTFEVDPDLERVKKLVEEVIDQVPYYDDLVLAATAGFSEEKYEYYTGNEILRLRDKEAKARGVFDANIDPADRPFEDPLAVFKRLREESAKKQLS